jgi:hydrogenase assembly chaperone HypC/HupF
MCISQLRRVLEVIGDDSVSVEDQEGRRASVSLIAYSGEPPCAGTWLIVHSGFALAAVPTAEAEATLADLARLQNHEEWR